jgi:hypothetical protein
MSPALESKLHPPMSPQQSSSSPSRTSNLSVNSTFVREDRPEGDRGIGSYWSLQQGMECRIRKFKARRRGERSWLTNPATGPLHINPQSAIPDMPSDTTPISTDSFVREERVDGGLSYPSIPPAIIRSLPRIDRYFPTTKATSPGGPQCTSSSWSWSHKRTFESAHNSGYCSLTPKRSHQLSPESHHAKKVRFSLPSDAYRPNINRGRAEEELARLRRSSYDPPSQCHATIPGSGRIPSSPSHQTLAFESQMPSPRAPRVSPQPSTSPYTVFAPYNIILHDI